MGSATAQIRVRYVETDQMGVVHHAAYLSWLEVARTEYLRGRGISYRELEALGIRLPVLDLEVTYHRPALYDDFVDVTAELISATPVRFTFRYTVRRPSDGALLCEALTEHAAVDPRGRPRRMPPELFSLLGAVAK
jgi:acyl-CoA thioester hydrolase